MIRIRHPDGRFDMVKTARLDDLIETKKLVALSAQAAGWSWGKTRFADQGLK